MEKRTGYCASWYIEYGLTSGAIVLNTLNTIALALSAIVLDHWIKKSLKKCIKELET